MISLLSTAFPYALLRFLFGGCCRLSMLVVGCSVFILSGVTVVVRVCLLLFVVCRRLCVVVLSCLLRVVCCLPLGWLFALCVVELQCCYMGLIST